MIDRFARALSRQRVVAVFGALAVFGATSICADVQDPQTLVTGHRIERALTADETQRYRVTLNEGDFLLVRVDKVRPRGGRNRHSP